MSLHYTNHNTAQTVGFIPNLANARLERNMPLDVQLSVKTNLIYSAEKLLVYSSYIIRYLQSNFLYVMIL